MKRFFVEKVSDKTVLDGENHNHLSFVLRAKVGDIITLCPEDGFDYIGKIEKIDKNSTTVSIVEKVVNELEPRVNVTLFMSLLKGDKMDLVAQKATELGVNTICPMSTKYTQTKAESVNLTRLNKIVSEASKQCGRGILPTVSPVITFVEMVKKAPEFDCVIFPYEKASEANLLDYFSSVIKEKTVKNLGVIIGSEGGFADEEAALLASVNVVPLTLGKRILRAETASISVISALMCLLGEWR